MSFAPRKTIAVLISAMLTACGGGSDNNPASQTTVPAASGVATATTPAPTSGNTNTPNTPSGPANSTASGTSTSTAAPAPVPAPASSPTPAPVPAPVPANYDQTARFANPFSIAVDGLGNVYVQDKQTLDYVDSINNPGYSEPIRKIAANGNVSTLATRYFGIIDMEARGDTLYAAVTRLAPELISGRTAVDIVKLGPDGNRSVLASYPLTPGSSTPFAVSADAQGHVYVAKRYRQYAYIDRIDPDGKKQQVYSLFTYNDVRDIRSDPQGTLIISYQLPSVQGGENYLTYVPLSAQPVTTAPLTGGGYGVPTAPGVVTRKVPFAGHFSVDDAGNVYRVSAPTTVVTPATFNTTNGTYESNGTYDLSAIRVEKLNASGNMEVTYNHVPAGVVARFNSTIPNYPVSFAAAPNGDMYVTLEYDHTVYKISPLGQETLVGGKNGEAGTSD